MSVPTKTLHTHETEHAQTLADQPAAQQGFLHIELGPPSQSEELAEITLIGPADKLEQLKRVAQLFEFDDAHETTSADDIIDALKPADFLFAYREREDLSHAALAKKVNISPKQLADFENGKDEIPVDVAKRIAEVLHCNYQHLVSS